MDISFLDQVPGDGISVDEVYRVDYDCGPSKSRYALADHSLTGGCL